MSKLTSSVNKILLQQSFEVLIILFGTLFAGKWCFPITNPDFLGTQATLDASNSLIVQVQWEDNLASMSCESTVWNLLDYFGIFWGSLETFWILVESFGICLILSDSYEFFWNLSNSFWVFWIPLDSFGIFRNLLINPVLEQLESFGILGILENSRNLLVSLVLEQLESFEIF